MAAALDGLNERDWDTSAMAPGQDPQDHVPKNAQQAIPDASNRDQDARDNRREIGARLGCLIVEKSSRLL